MYDVGQEFHDKMRAEKRRVYAKCQIDYTDPFMDQSIDVSTSENARYSYPRQTTDGLMEPAGKIASLDESWTLGDGYIPAPGIEESHYTQMGWWGSQLSQPEGVFVAPYPKLVISFFGRTIDSLRVVGDSAKGEYPKNFTITLWDKDDELLHYEVVNDNTETTWTKILEPVINGVARIELEIVKWSHPGRQVKILEFFSSLSQIYETEDIVSVRLLEEIEVSQGSLPIGAVTSNEVEIKLLNENGRFDAGNTDSPVHNLLRPNRRIQPYLGVNIDAGLWGIAVEQTVWDLDYFLMGGTLAAQGFRAVGSLEGATKVRASVVGSDRFFMPPDIEFHIYDDNNGIPGNSISPVGFATVQGSAWPEAAEPRWVMGEIDLDEALTENGQYWLVLTALAGYPNSYVKFRTSTVGPYSDGCYANLSGLSWSLQADTDLVFRLESQGKGKSFVPLGVFWSGDWTVPEDGMYAQTTGRDRLELLRQTTYNGSEPEPNKDLYGIAADILHDAGLTEEEYWVDPELQQFVIPYAYFSQQSHREALRRVAEACAGQIYCDRAGVIRVEGPVFDLPVVEEYCIDPDNYFRKDNPTKWGEVANYVEVETQPLTLTEETEIYKGETVTIAAGEEIVITAKYNHCPCVNATVTLYDAPVGAQINKVLYYAWGAEIIVSSPIAGSFRLIIDGKPLKMQSKETIIAQDKVSISENGRVSYTLPPNPFIQTRQAAQKVANAILAFYKDPKRNLEVEWRGNPAIELGDLVAVIDPDSLQSSFIVTKQELNYDGGFRANLTGRRITEEG